MEENGMWPVIGIDLGTTYSCVAIWRNDSIEIIPNEHGHRTTPSCVAFTDVGHFVGDAALIQALKNPLNTIFDAKRLIGRRFTDETVQSDINMWPFKVIEYLNDNEARRPAIEISVEKGYNHFLPEEISSMILVKMKEIAEAYLGSTVKNAVITVPAYFNDSQRQATKDAGKIAGLNVVKIINEPTAAAFAYGLGKALSVGNPKKNVLVFDLGGGTFDVSLICMEKNKYEVKSVNGDTHLGGGDFNNNMMSHFVKEFKRVHNIDISKNSRAIGKLRNATEKAKRILSSVHEAPIEIDSLFDGIDFSSTITRAKFENLNMELFRKCIGLVKKCLRDAKIEKSDIHDVVLVGGSTRIPKIQELLQDFFMGKELYKTINPDEAVAHGAAVHGAFLAGLTDKKDIVLFDVVPFPMGVELENGDMLVIVPSNTTVPTEKVSRVTTFYDNQTLVSIRVFEGDKQKAVDNHDLGNFVLDNIPPSPKGEPNIDVSFEIDSDGILTVSVEDVDTGMKNQITITKTSSLSNGEIDRMVEETKKRRAEDAEYNRKLKVKHAVEIYAHDIEERLRGYEGELGTEDMKKIKDQIEVTKSWIEWNFDLMATEFEEKLNELEEYCEMILARSSTIAHPPPPPPSFPPRHHKVLETVEANTSHEMTCSNSNDFLELWYEGNP